MARALFFSGVDGSGKTTAVARAVLEMRTCGVEPRVLWMRSLHTASYIVYSAIEGMLYAGSHPHRQFPEWARRAGAAWELLELASAIPHMAVLAVEKRLRPLVVDRGPADFIANVAVRSGGRIVYSRPVLDAVARLYRDSILVYLRVPPGSERVVVARKGRQLDYTIGELRSLIRAYDAVVGELACRGVSVVEIDSANVSLDELKRRVSAIVRSEICPYIIGSAAASRSSRRRRSP